MCWNWIAAAPRTVRWPKALRAGQFPDRSVPRTDCARGRRSGPHLRGTRPSATTAPAWDEEGYGAATSRTNSTPSKDSFPDRRLCYRCDCRRRLTPSKAGPCAKCNGAEQFLTLHSKLAHAYGFAIGKGPRRRSRIEAHDSEVLDYPHDPVGPEPAAPSTGSRWTSISLVSASVRRWAVFLTTLSRSLLNPDGSPRLESSCLPGTRSR